MRGARLRARPRLCARLDGVACGGDRTETQTALIDLLSTAQRRIDEIDRPPPGRGPRRPASYPGHPRGTSALAGTQHRRLLPTALRTVFSNRSPSDHLRSQEFIDAGFITAEEARTDPRRNVITRGARRGMHDRTGGGLLFVSGGTRRGAVDMHRRTDRRTARCGDRGILTDTCPR